MIDAFVYGTGTAPTVAATPTGTTGATGATGATGVTPPAPPAPADRRLGRGGRNLEMAKKIDPKAKAKRQKIYAGIGGVILLAVLAFQVPRTMKMMHPADASSSSPPPAATPASTPTPISAPSLSGGNAAAAAAAPGGDGITDPDAVPPPQSGQLLAFGLFRSKDPFVQQLELERCDRPNRGDQFWWPDGRKRPGGRRLGRLPAWAAARRRRPLRPRLRPRRRLG